MKEPRIPRGTVDDLTLGLRELHELSSRLLAADGRDGAYEQILDALLATVGSDFASVQLLEVGDHGVPTLRLVGHRGFSEKAARRWRSLESGSTTSCGVALREGRPVAIHDVLATTSPSDSGEIEAYRETGIRSMCTTPLRSRSGDILGMISTHWRDPHDLSARESRLLDILAVQVAQVFEHQRIDAALAASEERARLALDTAGMGSFIWYPLEDRGEPDDRMLTLFGLPLDGSLNLAVAMAGLIHPDDRERYAVAVGRAVDPDGDGLLLEDIRVVQPDGTERWLTIHARAQFAGQPPRAIRMPGVAIDISDRKRLEDARDAFMGILSHEMRTPITTIIGAADLLANEDRDRDTRHELLDDIAVEAGRLERLVDDLLVLARTQRGQLALDTEPVLVRHALDDALRTESRRYPDVTFVVEAPATLPPVAADPTYLGQVLRNLLSNAGKYGPVGACEVRVVAQLEDDRIEVRVLDEGPGFSVADGARLFELFFRDPANEHRQPGAGIGLYVTRTLVETMGGTVWAARRASGGAEFGFRLRVVDD